MVSATVTRAVNGDAVVCSAGWRASFIASPFRAGSFVLAAQSPAPERRMLFGLLPDTGYLVQQKRKPDVAQLTAFLDDCIAGRVIATTLEACARMGAVS